MVEGSNLVLSIILDGNGQHLKAMPESIPAPNSASVEEMKNIGSQMGQTDKKNTFKTVKKLS
jgi:hypothetical protein